MNESNSNLPYRISGRRRRLRLKRRPRKESGKSVWFRQALYDFAGIPQPNPRAIDPQRNRLTPEQAATMKKLFKDLGLVSA